jgi:hypothetical protein
MSASQQPSHFQIFGIRHNRNERLQHRVRRNEVLSSLGAAGLALMACLLVLNLRAAGQDVQKVSSKPSVFANTTSLNGPGNVFLTANAYGTGGTGPVSFDLADFNGDGKLDLAAANSGSNNIAVSLGNGDGTFQAAIATPVPCNPVWVAAGDFNGDGKLDLAVVAPGCSPGTNGVAILLGNGDGTFTAKPTLTSPLQSPVSAVVGDFNNDGKLDLAVVDRSAGSDMLFVFLGKGDGTFQAPASVNLGVSAAVNIVVAADFNKDGNLDLAVSFMNQAAVDVILGNGNGTFQAPRVLALPAGNGGFGLAVGDFNNDGIPDLVATTPNIGGISVFLGKGDGTFTPVNNPQSGTLPTAYGAVPDGGATSVAVGDFNKDGKLDVIVGLSGVNGAASVAVLLGNGDGTLQSETLFETADIPSFVTVADINGDGNLDWITNGTNTSYVAIGLGRGDGTFLAARNFSADVSPYSVAAADFNKDGKLDLVVTNSGSTDTSILLGNGDGTFQPAVNIAFPALSPSAVVTGDFNNDGNPDFVVFSQWCPNFVNAPLYTYLGKGDGTFQTPVTTTLSGLSSCASVNNMVAGDFNNDGKLDIAIAYNHDTGNPLIQILLGKGDGTFTPLTPFSTGGISFGAMVAGDLNKDGKLDLVATDFRNGQVKTFLGNGDGTFQAPTNLAVGRFPGGVVLGDFRGSGNLDIIVENELDGNAEILPGNGNGTFNSGTLISTGGNPLQNILAGDFNLDGKLDFIGNGGPSTTDPTGIRLFLGNGDGTFQAPQEYLADRVRQVWIVDDFDRDGSPDVLSLSGEQFLTVFLNQTPPPIAVSPASLSFGNQVVGTTSSALAIKVSNNGSTATTIGVAISGDFAETNTCPVSPATLAPATSCTISVTFKPTATGPLNGSITVSDALPGSPQIVALSGTGVTPIVTLGGSSIGFGNQIVGTTSAVQMVSLTNTGTATLNISSIAITGANSGDFSQTNTCGASVNAGANCSISVKFTPTATGNRAASVTITDNAAGSPQNVPLTGIGIAPVVSFGGTTTLTYSAQPVGTTSAAQSVTLTNTGNAALMITSIAITGANSGDFAQTNTCPVSPATLAAGANCKINVTFDPTATGARNASLGVTDDASGSPQNISLTGTGTPAAPAVGLSPTSLTFSGQLVGTTSAAQSVTLTNTGNAALTITSIAITGANSGDFAQTSTCPVSPTTLAAGSNCAISVTFKPTASGARNASVTITDNAANSPQSVTLSGTGAAPIVSLGGTVSLNFGNQLVGTTSAAQTITLSNTGTAALTITSIAITGTNSSDFAQTSTCPVSPTTLAAGANCAINVTFKPTAVGNRTGSVSFTDSAAGSPQSVALTGTGVEPMVTLAPASLTFAGQLITTTSAAQSVTLTNSGTAPLTIASIAITAANGADFGETNNCPASTSSLAVGAKCSINVTFTPTATGNRAASITIAGNAPGSPQSVSLTGTGTDFSLAAATGANCPAGANCSTSATISVGQTATYDLQVSPSNGFNGIVALSCTGAPSPSTCSVSPSSAPPVGSASYAFTVTVNNTANAMTLPMMSPPGVPRLPIRFGIPLVTSLAMMLMLAFVGIRTGQIKRLAVPALALLLLSIGCLSGCGGAGGGAGGGTKPPTNATITVTGTCSGVNRTLPLSLTINH